jgi:hypothetical protein
LISRTQIAGAFSEQLDWPDGTTVYARLQHREAGMVPGEWSEIPIVAEITDAPKIQLVPGSRRGH